MTLKITGEPASLRVVLMILPFLLKQIHATNSLIIRSVMKINIQIKLRPPATRKSRRISVTRSLQTLHSIKTNIKAKFVLIIFPFIFLVASLFCLIFCLTNESFYDTYCYTWFSTTFHLQWCMYGFLYSRIFNPICFKGYNHDFVKF